MICTPGRFCDILVNHQKMNLDNCRLLVLDEADRLLDPSFEAPLRSIICEFPHQRQTCLVSSTMPRSIQHFLKKGLVQPLIINVGRAGAASLNVIQ